MVVSVPRLNYIEITLTYNKRQLDLHDLQEFYHKPDKKKNILFDLLPKAIMLKLSKSTNYERKKCIDKVGKNNQYAQEIYLRTPQRISDIFTNKTS